MKTVITMLCLCAAAFGQTINITDNSPVDSPLHFKGTITFTSGQRPVCAITGHNNGNLPIVAYVVEEQGTNSNGASFDRPLTHDHFFKNDMVISTMAPQPGADFDTQIRCEIIYHQVKATTTASPLILTSKLVQFNDGSVWGDPTSIADLAFQRQDVITYLQSLQSASDLTSAVAQQITTGLEPGQDGRQRWAKMIMQQYLLEDATPQAIAADIQNRLATAQAHKPWLDALTAK